MVEDDGERRRKKTGSGGYFIVSVRVEKEEERAVWKAARQVASVCVSSSAIDFDNDTARTRTVREKGQREREREKRKGDPSPPRRNLKISFNGVYVAKNKNGHDIG